MNGHRSLVKCGINAFQSYNQLTMLIVKAFMFESKNIELAQEGEHSYDVPRNVGNACARRG